MEDFFLGGHCQLKLDSFLELDRLFMRLDHGSRSPNHAVTSAPDLVTARFLSERTWVRIPSGGPRNNGTSAIG
jgi:hypothetical protein